MKLGIVGLGWWGGTLVESVQNSPSVRFISAYTRSRSPRDREFAASHELTLADSYEALLADPQVDGVVLATQPHGHCEQIVAAAECGKHVFCEKPLVMSKSEAERALAAVQKAGVTLAVGYNRRFHPSWIDLRRRIVQGELGIVLHLECTMSTPNGLTMAGAAWRAQRTEAPCGGLFPLGVHAIDGFIDLVGEVSEVFCRSVRRAIANDNDDTTSVVLQMKHGMTAYLSTMMAAAGGFRFQVYGTLATATLGGSTHVAGQSSQQRRTGLFGSYLWQPTKADALALDVPVFDVNRAELEAFAHAAQGRTAYPISPQQMVHAVAVTDAIIRSAQSGRVEAVG